MRYLLRPLALVFALCPATLLHAQTPPRPRPVPRDPNASNLEAFLAEHADIAKHIVWVAGDGKEEPFASWSRPQKARIELFYRGLLSHKKDLGMHLPAGADFRGYYTADQAFDIYAAHVAHIVYVEAEHFVPWSIEKRPAVELDQLLRSSSYFSRIKPSNRKLPKEIEADRDFLNTPENALDAVMIGDPRVGFDFVTGKSSSTHEKLVGTNELDTLRNLTIWLRDNVGHGPLRDGHESERNKTLRWLDDRLKIWPEMGTLIAVHGCHSASRLMVDLARSVNLPLLHTESLDTGDGEEKKPYLNRTHGGLVYGWGSKEPRIVWHTDTLYAREGKFCFPIDPATGQLLSKSQADQLYFDSLWVTRRQLESMQFVITLDTTYPNKGLGHDADPKYEERYDYGTCLGYWKGMSHSAADQFFDWYVNYQTCGDNLLHLAANHVVVAQLQNNFKKWSGTADPRELPPIPPLNEFNTRANAALTALGGAEKFKELDAPYKKIKAVTYLPDDVTYGEP
jgi:hypothetical protein